MRKVVETGSIDDLVAGYIDAEVEKFSRRSVKDKIKYLVKLKVNEEGLFDHSVFDRAANPRINEWTLDRLIEIYNCRHEIVHNDIQHFQEIQQFEDIYDFYVRICLWVSVEVPKAIPEVMNEFTRDSSRSEIYARMKAKNDVGGEGGDESGGDG